MHRENRIASSTGDTSDHFPPRVAERTATSLKATRSVESAVAQGLRETDTHERDETEVDEAVLTYGLCGYVRRTEWLGGKPER
jgi:hypothetical protein